MPCCCPWTRPRRSEQDLRSQTGICTARRGLLKVNLTDQVELTTPNAGSSRSAKDEELRILVGHSWRFRLSTSETLRKIEKICEEMLPFGFDPCWPLQIQANRYRLCNKRCSYGKVRKILPSGTSVREEQKRFIDPKVKLLRSSGNRHGRCGRSVTDSQGDYKSIHPPLEESNEPDCPIRQMVTPFEGAKKGDISTSVH
jgi:hypothetical protein